jgi:hypothetical protein
MPFRLAPYCRSGHCLRSLGKSLLTIRHRTDSERSGPHRSTLDKSQADSCLFCLPPEYGTPVTLPSSPGRFQREAPRTPAERRYPCAAPRALPQIKKKPYRSHKDHGRALLATRAALLRTGTTLRGTAGCPAGAQSRTSHSRSHLSRLAHLRC